MCVCKNWDDNEPVRDGEGGECASSEDKYSCNNPNKICFCHSCWRTHEPHKGWRIFLREEFEASEE